LTLAFAHSHDRIPETHQKSEQKKKRKGTKEQKKEKNLISPYPR
jgi:hypothetical protein